MMRLPLFQFRAPRTLEEAAHILAGIAAGLTTADQAYSKEFLYSRAVQILQSQMRAKRSDVVSHIVVRASSSVIEYPLGMAMTDLEELINARFHED